MIEKLNFFQNVTLLKRCFTLLGEITNILMPFFDNDEAYLPSGDRNDRERFKKIVDSINLDLCELLVAKHVDNIDRECLHKMFPDLNSWIEIWWVQSRAVMIAKHYVEDGVAYLYLGTSHEDIDAVIQSLGVHANTRSIDSYDYSETE